MGVTESQLRSVGNGTAKVRAHLGK
ncbi:DUF3606 domain-containing protein [Enterobacter cloacae]|nr:DUF3606 domain-containing protein [Enterobacter cloacae]MCM7404773.1 DUF3606 domain-containing protein [Enterobacter cloacae]